MSVPNSSHTQSPSALKPCKPPTASVGGSWKLGTQGIGARVPAILVLALIGFALVGGCDHRGSNERALDADLEHAKRTSMDASKSDMERTISRMGVDAMEEQRGMARQFDRNGDHVLDKASPPQIKVGMVLQPINATNAAILLRQGITQGLYIAQVEPNGPAARAGIRAGDFLLEPNGKWQESPNPNLPYFDPMKVDTMGKSPGDSVTYTIVRNWQRMQGTLILGAR